MAQFCITAYVGGKLACCTFNAGDLEWLPCNMGQVITDRLPSAPGGILTIRIMDDRGNFLQSFPIGDRDAL